MLEGKAVLLGVTGDITCYKSAGLASTLVKREANVQVFMTRNATEFVGPHTFESLTGNRADVDTSGRNYQFQVEHIALADQADLVLVAPVTANVLARLTHGLADDMLTTTVLIYGCPKIVAPAMNTRVYGNPVTQDNLALLQRYGQEIVEPANGRLACGAVGEGEMPEPEELLETMLRTFSHVKDMEGLEVLVTAGSTQEALDPMRHLTNHSTGRMSYAIARATAVRGAKATLTSGPTALRKPAYMETVDVVSAQDMFEAITACAPEQNIIIRAAVMAGYRPAQVVRDKVKKGEGELSIPLERTQDILAWLGGHRRPRQFLCGFSMGTQDMVEDSRRKLEKKHLDLIAANSLGESGAGFTMLTNLLALISPRGELELPLLTKEETAHRLLDEILKLR